MGCRGFPPRSGARLLRDLGYTGRKRKDLLRKIEEVAEEAIWSIWRWGAIKEWGKKTRQVRKAGSGGICC